MERVVNAMCKEVELKKEYLKNESINTIYFGGGTPSFLSFNLLNKIVQGLKDNFKISGKAEFTVECNPDDLTEQKLDELIDLGVNRLSVGIQSFEDEMLQFLNRAHNQNQAIESIHLAKKKGIHNISVDLIYGLPQTNLVYLQNQINQLISLDIPHISAYHLTIEKKTAFGNWFKKGELIPLSDEESLAQFKCITENLKKAGYNHYEISNFAKEDFISQHNSAYWLGQKYAGIGPSAHSFDGKTRQWNVANNILYAKALEENTNYFEIETLSKIDQFNEYILTRLRTHWGINLDDMKEMMPQMNETEKKLIQFKQNGFLYNENKTYFLTEEGKFISDFITESLIIV